MGNGKGAGQKERAQLDSEEKQLQREYEQLNKEAESRWDRYTEAHRKAHTAVKDAEKHLHEAADKADKASDQARTARAQADKLEADFNAKVDQMARTGQPDPNPAQTRALADQMDQAARAADQAETAASDASHVRETARIHFRRAYDDNEAARSQDPVYQQEIQPKLDDFYRRQDEWRDKNNEWRNKYETDAQADADFDSDAMATTAAASAATGSALLADTADQGSVGDEGEDADLAALGQAGPSGEGDSQLVGSPAADLDGGTSAPESSLADWSSDTGGEPQLDGGAMDAPAIDPTLEQSGGDVFTEQPAEPEVAYSEPPAEEFVDEGVETA